MNIEKLMEVEEVLPKNLKSHITDFKPVVLKDGRNAMRITLDKILSYDERRTMKKNKKIIGVDCITYYRYAPEIQYSYFYVLI